MKIRLSLVAILCLAGCAPTTAQLEAHITEKQQLVQTCANNPSWYTYFFKCMGNPSLGLPQACKEADAPEKPECIDWARADYENERYNAIVGTMSSEAFGATTANILVPPR